MNVVRTRRTSNNRRRGSSIIEFALVGSFMFLPILAGLATVGLSLVTALQVSSLNSNAGQMFAAGVDFTQSSNLAIVGKLSGNLNITGTSGYGLLILSEIDGTSNGNTCSNQIIVGNSAIGSSRYCPNPPCVQSGFTALMGGSALAVGQVSYVAETFYNNPLYAWALAPHGTGTGIYTSAVF